MTDRAVTRLLVKRVRAAAKDFPAYGIPRAVGVVREPFTVESGLLTPHDEAAPPGDSGPLRGLGREPLRGAQDRVIRI